MWPAWTSGRAGRVQDVWTHTLNIFNLNLMVAPKIQDFFFAYLYRWLEHSAFYSSSIDGELMINYLYFG
jgi:hypothetical protein